MRGGAVKFNWGSPPLCIRRALEPRRTAALRWLPLNVEPLNVEQLLSPTECADEPALLQFS